IYGIAGGKGKLDRPLTRADITTPTPYNTYTIKGLPPGPIANPGRAALEAVVNPPETVFLYFVADGTGGHAFAATLEEHNRNVAKWRELEGNAAKAASEMADDIEPQPETKPVSTKHITLPDIETPEPLPIPQPVPER
ncbi:MAG: endolytic transglycosylase MltG, partial [Aestuariivirga sp.]